MPRRFHLLATLVVALAASRNLHAAQLILPQERQAYYTSEAIELAVAGLAKDGVATIELVPQGAGPSIVRIPVKGDGSTVAVILPAGALAWDFVVEACEFIPQ